ncbi:MAG: hypothetical protein ACRDD6_14775 [Tannerellaceae bacterium]
MYLHAFRTLVWRNGWIFRVWKTGFSYWGVGGYMGSMAALYCKMRNLRKKHAWWE